MLKEAVRVDTNSHSEETEEINVGEKLPVNHRGASKPGAAANNGNNVNQQSTSANGLNGRCSVPATHAAL